MSALLLLGATSLIGRPLRERLAAEGGTAVALSRAERASEPGVRWVRGSLDDPAWAEGLPAVERCLSLSPIWLLPQAVPALAGAGVRRLVAFSSTSRFTKAASPEPEERAMAARLAEAEAATIAACEPWGIAWTILRPTLIYDEGRDANVTRLAGLIRRLGVLPLAGRGDGLRQPVHAADLAEGALAALDAPAADRRAYDLPGGETLSYRAMAERVFEGLGRRPQIVPVPAALWRAAFAAAGRWLPGATAAMGARMAEDMVFDGGPARRDFGWSPQPFHPRFPPRRTWSSSGERSGGDASLAKRSQRW